MVAEYWLQSNDPATIVIMEADSVTSLMAIRSDDGGCTWQCMNLPLVRQQVYLPLLRIRSRVAP